jgi:putative ABC transport system ATP-binding protein
MPATMAGATVISSPQPSPNASSSGRPTAELAAKLRAIKKIYYKPDGSVLVEALKGIDLDVPHGQYMAIMGASGSGKSTLMNLLGCLDRPTSGSYHLDGINVATMPDDQLSRVRGRRIGFVFQAFNLITELTIVENVEVPLFYQGLGGPERRDRAIRQLERVGLGDRLTHRPIELSGGQQQRVAIARALVTHPAVLMADEPTGNLDSTTGETILRLFEELHAEGLTLIMVTHDNRIADRCERMIRLKDGLIEIDSKGGGYDRRVQKEDGAVKGAPGQGS